MHHKTTGWLKTYFLCLQLSAVQEDQDIPRTGSLSTNRPSRSQWRSAWPCIRQQWARRPVVLLLLWWDDASAYWEMTIKVCWWLSEKCVDLKYGIINVMLPVFIISFPSSDFFYCLISLSLCNIVQENRKKKRICNEVSSSAEQKPKSLIVILAYILIILIVSKEEKYLNLEIWIFW